MDLRQHIQDSPVRVVRVRWWLLRIYYWTHNMECIRQKSASILFTTLAPVGTLRHFLDEMRQKIIDDMAKIKAEAAAKAKTSKDKNEAIKRQKASLFLQDFPYGGLYGLHWTISKDDLILKLNFCSSRNHFRGTEKAAKRC